MVLGCPRFLETPQYHSLSVSWTTHTDRLHCPSSSLIFRINNHQNTPRIRKPYRVDPRSFMVQTMGYSTAGLRPQQVFPQSFQRAWINELWQGSMRNKMKKQDLHGFTVTDMTQELGWQPILGWNPLDFRTSPSASDWFKHFSAAGFEALNIIEHHWTSLKFIKQH